MFLSFGSGFQPSGTDPDCPHGSGKDWITMGRAGYELERLDRDGKDWIWIGKGWIRMGKVGYGFGKGRIWIGKVGCSWEKLDTDLGKFG